MANRKKRIVTHEIDSLFEIFKKDFIQWLAEKPTGKFFIEVNANQGGIIGKPKIGRTQNI